MLYKQETLQPLHVEPTTHPPIANVISVKHQFPNN